MTQLTFDFGIDWNVCRPIRRSVRRVRRSYSMCCEMVQLAFDFSAPRPRPQRTSIWRRIWNVIRNLIGG